MITLERPAFYENNRYAEYCGLSGDDKATIKAHNGDEFYEIDTGKVYKYNAENNVWVEQPKSGGGGGHGDVSSVNGKTGAVVLTADDIGALPDTTIIPDTNNFMTKANPVGTGALSINRKSGTTIGNNSCVIGDNCEASAQFSFACGLKTNSSGETAHAEGNSTVASGAASHAEGLSTRATNTHAHAEGNATTASGVGAHSEGNKTTASGNYSHAEGIYTVARNRAQHVQGEYNLLDTPAASAKGNYAHIVGNGTSTSERSNAHTLDWAGNAWFAGDVYVGSTGGVNKDSGSKKLITNELDSNLYLNGNAIIGVKSISDADSGLAIESELSMNNHKITDLLDPTDAQDAVTVNYLDNVVAQLNVVVNSINVALADLTKRVKTLEDATN